MDLTKYPNYKPLDKMSTNDNRPEWLIIHHTSGGGFPSFESVQNFHVTDSHYLFENIGYHYFIEKDGLIKKGRPEHYHGAHCKEKSMNKKSIGVCLSGDFDKFMPTEEQIKSLKSLLMGLMAKYNITPDKIVPHRYFAVDSSGKPYKSCFGSKLSDSWARELVSSECVCLKDADLKQVISRLKELI